MIHLDQFEIEVVNALRELEIGAHLRGYEHIKTAMNILRKDPKSIKEVIKLYTSIGEIHDASPSKVERSIRHAIQNANSDFITQKKVLGTSRELTNGEFLATLAESIRLKMAGERVGS